MFNKLGLSALALGTMLAFSTPRPAQAKIHIGVQFVSPAYPVPIDPYAYSYAYPYGNAYPYGYAYGYPYGYYGPSYMRPFTYGYGGYGHFHGDRDDWGRFGGHFGRGRFAGGHFGGHFGGGHFGGHGGRH